MYIADFRNYILFSLILFNDMSSSSKEVSLMEDKTAKKITAESYRIWLDLLKIPRKIQSKVKKQPQ